MKSEIRPFLVAAFGFLLIIQIIYLGMAFPAALRGRADFCMLYTSGYMVRTGHASELYNYDSNARFQTQVVSPSHGAMPFNHLAYETLFFVPLSFAPYRTAYKIFLAMNLGLILLSFQTIRPYTVRLNLVWSWLPAVIFACFLPIGIALFQGQDSILLMTLFLCSFVAMEKGHDFASGIFLGLTIFKFQFALPIALLFFIWRKWRIISAFVMTSMAVVTISFLLTGLGSLTTYPRYLLSMSTGLTTAGDQVRYGTYPVAMPNIFGLLFAIGGNHSALTAIISLAVLAWAARSRPSFAVAIAAAMLVSYHALIHDASILIIPLLLLAEKALRSGPRGYARVWVSASVLAYPSLAVCFALPYCLLAVPIMGFLGWSEHSGSHASVDRETERH